MLQNIEDQLNGLTDTLLSRGDLKRNRDGLLKELEELDEEGEDYLDSGEYS